MAADIQLEGLRRGAALFGLHIDIDDACVRRGMGGVLFDGYGYQQDAFNSGHDAAFLLTEVLDFFNQLRTVRPYRKVIGADRGRRNSEAERRYV